MSKQTNTNQTQCRFTNEYILSLIRMKLRTILRLKYVVRYSFSILHYYVIRVYSKYLRNNV